MPAKTDSVTLEELQRIAYEYPAFHGKMLYPVECQVEGCERDHGSRGMCSKHWLRWMRAGRIEIGPDGPCVEDAIQREFDRMGSVDPVEREFGRMDGKGRTK